MPYFFDQTHEIVEKILNQFKIYPNFNKLTFQYCGGGQISILICVFILLKPRQSFYLLTNPTTD